MESFATDFERMAWLLETDAQLELDFDRLAAEAGASEGKGKSGDGEKDSDGKDSDGKSSREAPGELPPDKRPKYITNYIGSKQKLVDWIWKNTPDDAKSVADAFSGSAVVAYMFKTKGLKVFANDRLRYCYHAARAIVENDSVRLSKDDIEKLLTSNASAGSFVRDNFKGIFFAKGVHAIIDQIRANADKFDGYKKDIALFALGKTCMSGKGGFGHFSSSTEYGKRQDTAEEFRERFRKNVERINALVFKGERECKASRQDVNEFLKSVKADAAYFDPPYATEFSTTNYEKSYHFVEGLMSYWKGIEIRKDTKTKHYDTDHVTVTKANASDFFETFLGSAKHIPHWLISYRDHAYPNEGDMKKIISGLGRDSLMKSKSHHYAITSKHGEASNAIERLFVCKRKAGAAASAEDFTDGEYRPCRTEIPVEFSLTEAGELNAQALDLGTNDSGDPQFSFILCRVGTNRNGDHFSPDELRGRFMSAINKKVDLKHSQDFGDIVGGIVSSDFVEDDNGGRVECVGELYTRDSENARLAYKLMKKGIISQVSMECDYEEGECSICGKRVKTKVDYCVHLRKFKGREYQGKPVYEILHGVSFSGLGLLDRKGADENARIIQVASNQKGTSSPFIEPDKSAVASKTGNHSTPFQQGEEPVAKDQEQQDAEAAKKKSGGGEPPEGGGDSARLKELEQENAELKQKLTEAQKRIQELESEQKAAANRSRAEKLLRKVGKQGVSFESDEDRNKELERLAGLTDDAFAATEAAYDRLPKQPPKKGDDDTKPNAQPESSKASGDEPGMQFSASVRPQDVDDSKPNTLEERLRKGFLSAYQQRVGVCGSDQ